MLFDTHAHLLAEQFESDRDETLARTFAQGVSLYLEAGTTLCDSACAVAWAQRHVGVYCAAGIHPHEAQQAPNDYLRQLHALLLQDKCVALGEIGLDYHYDFSAREVQRRVFAEQLELAVACRMPVIIHDREAHADTMAALSAHRGQLTGVLHCYSGSLEDARRYLDMGFYLSFGGPLTFKNAQKLPEIAAFVPQDRILSETDSPYLTPVPLRGKRNEPANVRLVVEKLAQLRGISFDQMAQDTCQNGKRLFGIEG